MRLGVVVPCHRQEPLLPRTVAALERALAGHDWSAALVQHGGGAPLPPLGERWRVLSAPAGLPVTPGGARMLGCAATEGDSRSIQRRNSSTSRSGTTRREPWSAPGTPRD